MISPSCCLPLVTGLALALSACSSNGASPSISSERCDATAAQELLRRERLTDADAQLLTGARIVRQIQPGEMVTEDYREDRVTIETDPVSGLVVKAACG